MLKLIAREMDERIFGGAVRRFYGRQLTASNCRQRLRKATRQLDSQVAIHYAKDCGNELTVLCDAYGSDKGSFHASGHTWSWKPHSYTAFYDRLFRHCRPHVKRVFECGLGTSNPVFADNMGPGGRPGASLRAWRDYFPDASVFGADIDRAVLFDEERIRTFYVDQTSPESISLMWKQVGCSDFDFMVDDGLHTFAAGSCLFENSISHLREGGIYVIEDVTSAAWESYISFFRPYGMSIDLIRFQTPDGRDTDSSLVVIRK
jgi:hypothetical protein